MVTVAHTRQNHRMPVRALRLTSTIKGIPNRSSESSNARQGIKTHPQLLLRLRRYRQNHRMPVRALRLMSEKPWDVLKEGQNHRMPVRALRRKNTRNRTNIAMSESSNARQGIKTQITKPCYGGVRGRSESSNARQGIKT